MKFIATMQQGKLILPEVQRQLRQRFVATLKDGQRVEETLVRKSDPKTQQQLGYHFGVIVALMIACFEERGIDLFGCTPTVRFTKEILYKACAENDDDGRRLTLSKMDKKQASEFIDRCINWAATELGLYIPPAQKNWKDNKNNLGKPQ